MEDNLLSPEFLKSCLSLSDRQIQEFMVNLRRIRRLGNKSCHNHEEVIKFLERCICNDSGNDVALTPPVTDDNIYNLLELATPFLEQLNQIFCFKNADYIFMGCNRKFIDFGKFASIKKILGCTDFEMPWVEGSSFYRKLDHDTLHGKCFKTLMPLRITTGDQAVVLQEKYPLRDESGNIKGITIKMNMISNKNVLKPFISLCESDLITPTLFGYASDKYLIQKTYCSDISQEESKCLFYAIRGKSAKEIGKILMKSPKTVESYLEHIKHKLNCNSKSELISKSIELGLINIIPEQILNYYLQKC